MIDYTALPTITELTEENLRAMMNAQFLTLADALRDAATNGYSDDDIDYLPTALDLANVLMHADYDGCDFTLEQLRHHIAYIPTDDVAIEIMQMLFDSQEHHDGYELPLNVHTPATYDCVNPETWTL